MKKRSIVLMILLTLLCSTVCGCKATSTESSTDTAQNTAASQDVLYQVSTLDALMQGVYDGEMSLGQLTSHGNFGIGTFDGLDGEMVVLDGQVYQVPADGKVIKKDSSTLTPFAMVTEFETDSQLGITNIKDYAQLQEVLNDLLPSQNMFYAIKVEGTFANIKTRSVQKQTEPYPPLVEVTSQQTVFEFNNVKGTLVGFWCPEYFEGINLPGYHLHFISDDLTMGGHLLDCSMKEGTIFIDTTTECHMLLPENEHFAQTNLNSVSEEDKQKAEK